MLNATYTIDNENQLYDALIAEKEDLVTNRAKVTILQESNTITITLNATDFPAFRALESAIMRLLATYYKMKGVENKK
jgi:tRNA threonylcarbamoyladenosine modification (KEOPS) complex  Pcc1 subunit